MQVKFIKDASLEALEIALSEVAKCSQTILLLSCDENDYDKEQFNRLLQKGQD